MTLVELLSRITREDWCKITISKAEIPLHFDVVILVTSSNGGSRQVLFDSRKGEVWDWNA